MSRNNTTRRPQLAEMVCVEQRCEVRLALVPAAPGQLSAWRQLWDRLLRDADEDNTPRTEGEAAGSTGPGTPEQ